MRHTDEQRVVLDGGGVVTVLDDQRLLKALVKLGVDLQCEDCGKLHNAYVSAVVTDPHGGRVPGA